MWVSANVGSKSHIGPRMGNIKFFITFLTMDKSVWAPEGIVTTPHHLSTQAALSVLKEGGTAIEATVAAAAVLAVVYPHMNGLGGDGFWLIFPPQGEPIVIEACGAAGSLAKKNFYKEGFIPKSGPKAAVTVAGTVGGWQEALKYSIELGYQKKSISQLLADAIRYAEDGYPVSTSLRKAIMKIALTANDELKQIFMPEGRIPKLGEKIKHPALAETLKQLTYNGLDSFYRGDVATAIAKDLANLGTPIIKSDLENYAPARKLPLQLKMERLNIYNTPPPTQGVASLIILGILERLNIDNKNESELVHNVIEATKLAFKELDKYVTDPQDMKIDPQSLLSDTNLCWLARKMNDMPSSIKVGDSSGDTIWMGVMDNKGFSVSFIQSLFHEFGSKVILPNSGIIWHNRGVAFNLKDGHLRSLRPRKKPFHTLNPAGVKFDDGRIMVYGTRGGNGQPQTQAVLFTRYIKLGMNIQKAISEPRWLYGDVYEENEDRLNLEIRFSDETLECLKKRGHNLNLLSEYADEVGYAGILVRHPDGMLEGGYDPRSDGSVAGF